AANANKVSFSLSRQICFPSTETVLITWFFRSSGPIWTTSFHSSEIISLSDFITIHSQFWGCLQNNSFQLLFRLSAPSPPQSQGTQASAGFPLLSGSLSSGLLL